MMTKIVAAIMLDTVEQGLAAASRARQLGAQMVEFRIDRIAGLDTARIQELRKLVADSPLPCIITCRPTWEGGEYQGDEQTRVSLLEHLGTSEKVPAYVDMELAAYAGSSNLRQKVNLIVDHPGQMRKIGTALILSSHDFQARPADWHARMQAMLNAPACRVAKLAWKGQEGDLRDNLLALDMVKMAVEGKAITALVMGEGGLLSRVLGKKAGAFLTFAALNEQNGTAPGQPTIDELKNRYGWDKISQQTKVYGLIGWPVSHSLGPVIHNAGFRQVGFDGVYLPMPVAPDWEQFKNNLQAMLDHDILGLAGVSVTLPHKEHLVRFIKERQDKRDQMDPLVEKVGAANTLVVRDDGSLEVRNTDYEGALRALCDGMGIKTVNEIAGVNVAVLGAGGAARAVIAGLAAHGAHVVVYGRTKSKVQTLVHSLNGQFKGSILAADWQELSTGTKNHQVYVNCTPVGMYPNVQQMPVELQVIQQWEPGTVVFDTIYNPAQTQLLKQAQTRGCVTISGLEMFVRQAALQFHAWTGRPGPIDLFRQVLSAR